MSCVEDQQREGKQPLVKPSAVVAAGLASSVAAFFTSRFGVAGTVIGAALTTMIITAGSAVFGVYLERAAARARDGIPSVVRARPPRRRSVLLGSLLAAVASFVVGMGAVTGLELSVGKSLSCWVWDECPTNDGGGRAAASQGAARTRPSILGGDQRTVAPTSQPGRVEHPRQTAAPLEQGVPASPRAPQGRPGGVGAASPGPRNAPQQRPVVPAEDAGPRQAPGGRQPAQEPSGGTAPPARQAPGEQPSPAPRDSDQPVPSDEPPAPDRPLRPSPSIFQ
jgi:hypothetical protein